MADQAAKEGAAGGLNLKQLDPLMPWQVAKNKIEEYTNNKWTNRWKAEPQYKRTKLHQTNLGPNTP